MLIRIVPGPAAARCCVRMRAVRLTGWALGELTWEERLKEELKRGRMFPKRGALGPRGWGRAAFGLTGGCGGGRRVGSSAGDLTRNRSKGVKRGRGRGEHILFRGCYGSYHTLDSLKQ